MKVLGMKRKGREEKENIKLDYQVDMKDGGKEIKDLN